MPNLCRNYSYLSQSPNKALIENYIGSRGEYSRKRPLSDSAASGKNWTVANAGKRRFFIFSSSTQLIMVLDHSDFNESMRLDVLQTEMQSDKVISVEVILLCPSGALHTERHDGSMSEWVEAKGYL